MGMGYRKTAVEIAQMRAAGLIVWQAHQIAAEWARPGVTTAEIDAAVETYILAQGAAPLFKGQPGRVPFPATTCISVNNEVVHGIPGPRALREGDIISIDIGCRLNGWCADAAQTHPVGAIAADRRRLLAATEGALRLALGAMRSGGRWSAIARRMEQHVRAAGCAMVAAASGLTGHGVGRELWEAPVVPNVVARQYPDFTLETGMVIAVEPMVNLVTSRVRLLDDDWTIVSRDGSPSAHFEHTIALTADGPQVLTAGPEGQGWALPF
jgi:methionyl aminopeptidase